jgi:hypothetical protein
MGIANSRRAQRVNAGEIFGYQCYICEVPTAATIEHIHPRSQGGLSGFDNIRIACPWCNTKKGTKPLEQFLAEGGHLIQTPELPRSVEELLVSVFGWDGIEPVDGSEVVILTGTPSARLVLQSVAAVADVVFAAWNFLVRHYTPQVAKTAR